MIFSDSLAPLYELVVFMMKFKGAIFAADLVALIIEPMFVRTVGMALK